MVYNAGAGTVVLVALICIRVTWHSEPGGRGAEEDNKWLSSLRFAAGFPDVLPAVPFTGASGVEGKSVEVPLIGPRPLSTTQRTLYMLAIAPRVRLTFFLHQKLAYMGC